MPQALAQILSSLNPVYDPQRASNAQEMAALTPQQQAEQAGLDQTKTSAFSDITNQANRNGLFYSGLPIAEEQKYVGGQYLPAVANLQAKYDQQKFGLQDALAKITADQYNQAYGIQSDQQKQEDALALANAQRAANGSAGASPTFTFNPPTPATNPAVLGANITLRQTWQQEANKGDWAAQTLLNYVGDNNRYDGPVNSQSEYNILKSHGVTGNYYLRPAAPAPTSGRQGLGGTPRAPIIQTRGGIPGL